MPAKIKVLVAYDGSAFSDAAVADLRRAGLGQNPQILVLTVADLWVPPAETLSGPAAGWYGAAFDAARLETQASLKQAKALAEKAAARLRRDFPQGKIQTKTLVDSPAHGVLKTAEKWKPSLIVMGSQGRTALGRLLLGSVSQKVLAHAPADVRIVRPPARKGAGAPRILVAVDGSKDSEKAVRSVASRDWGRNAEVRVVVVLDYRLSLAQAFESPSGQALLRGMVRRGSLAERLAGKAEATLKKAGLKVGTVVREGDPRRELLLEAKRFKAGSLFLGSRGLSAWQRFFLGSVSLNVASHAHCAVEIVR